jgi:hypothetical protein
MPQECREQDMKRKIPVLVKEELIPQKTLKISVAQNIHTVIYANGARRQYKTTS